MFRKTLLPWAWKYAGIISVTGSLILFFSWVITKNYADKYSSAKSSSESAESTFRLYTTLHEQRAILNSLAMEIKRLPTKPESARLDGDQKEIADLRERFNKTRLSASQIYELVTYSAETLDLSQGNGETTETSKRIEELFKSIWNSFEVYREKERAAETAATKIPTSLAELRPAVEAYVDHYHTKDAQKVAELYPQIVDASNQRRDEIAASTAQIKKASKLATFISLWTYAFGTVILILGQLLDKTKPKDKGEDKAIPDHNDVEAPPD